MGAPIVLVTEKIKNFFKKKKAMYILGTVFFFKKMKFKKSKHEEKQSHEQKRLLTFLFLQCDKRGRWKSFEKVRYG